MSDNECKIKHLELEDGRVIDVPMREDGYIQATKIFQSAGKRLCHWKDSPKTKSFIQLLSKETGLKEEELVHTFRGNTTKYEQGTWIHPKLAIHMTLWLSSYFCLQVTNWIEEWISHKKENYYKFLYEIYKTIPDNEDDLILKEKAIQRRLQNELGGEIEVKTNVGYIDLLTNDEIIEIKEGSCWKHAVGQVLMYAVYYPNHQRRIHLFNVEPTPVIEACCKSYDIIVSYEHV